MGIGHSCWGGGAYPIEENTVLSRYVPKESGVDAILLTGANLKDAAKLCGGKVGSRTAPQSLDDAYDIVLSIPTLSGAPEQAAPGDYLVRDEDGRWTGWNRTAFEAKYKKVARRGEPIAINRATGGSVEPKGWGLNSDSP